MESKEYLEAAEGEESLRQTISLQHPHIADLEFGPYLGSGAFGKVYRAKWKGASVAVKVIGHHCAGTATNQKVSNEVMIGRHALHPNVVAVYDVLTQPVCTPSVTGGSSTLETLLIMERADRGSLEDHLEKLSDLKKQPGDRGLMYILLCLLDVVYGLEYLHSIGIVHGDLKPANILCKSSGSDARGYMCKLCDFGLASSSHTVEALYTAKGTILYASPERLRGESLRPANDIYSFGILAWQILDDDDHQAHMPQLQLVHQVLHNDWRPDFPADTPRMYQDMVRSAWAPDAETRPTFTTIRGVLKGMLESLV